MVLVLSFANGCIFLNLTSVLLVLVGQGIWHMPDVHLWCLRRIHSVKLEMEYLGLPFVSMKQISHHVIGNDVSEFAEERGWTETT